jgi:hypothetical protein
MSIEVRVLSLTDGLPVEGTPHIVGSPAEAIFLAEEYGKRFPAETHEVRIFVPPSVGDEDRAALHRMAQGRGLHLDDNPAG